MKNKIKIEYRPFKDCSELLLQWNQSVNSSETSITFPGVSMTHEWSETLNNTRLQDKEAIVFLFYQNDQLIGAMPFYQSIQKTLFLERIKIHQFVELHNTRSGLLIFNNQPDYFDAFIRFLLDNEIDWSTLSFIINTNESLSHTIDTTLRQHNIPFHCQKAKESLYMNIPQSEEALLAQLNKKFRYTIKSSIKNLTALGDVDFKIYRTVEEVEGFLEQVYDIERNSWKEEAGTSITSNPFQMDFYNEFTPKAALKGWLSGGVLSLNGSPIAYNFGILFNGIYECLKTSYKDEFKKYSPGHVAYFKVLGDLISQKVELFDFLGEPETSKKKWASKLYHQDCYTLYNKNLKGQFSYALYQLKKRLNSS